MTRALNLLLFGLLLVLAGPGLTQAQTPMGQAEIRALENVKKAGGAIADLLNRGVDPDQIMAALFSMTGIDPAAAVEAALLAEVPKDDIVLADAFAAPEVIDPGAVIQAALRAGLDRDAIFNAAIIAGIHRDLIVAAINADLPPGMLAYVPPTPSQEMEVARQRQMAAIRFADLMKTSDLPIRDDSAASPIQP